MERVVWVAPRSAAWSAGKNGFTVQPGPAHIPDIAGKYFTKLEHHFQLGNSLN